MAQSYQAMTDEALVQALVQAERELVRQRFQLSMGQLENTSTLRTLRKDIARIKTEASRREAEQGLARNAIVNKYARSVDVDAAPAAAPKARGGFLKGVVDKLAGDE
jgi:large subunit ribosomal protein L29